jgi:hypothetical protein
MEGQEMKRRPLDRNARSLEPETQLSENIVKKRSSRVPFVSQCRTSPSDCVVA